MNLHSMVKTKTIRSAKRVGRGYASGKGGHASGRGQKGMKARSKPKLAFSGTKNKKSWLKRLPLWRGKGRLKSSRNPVSIRLEVIDALYKDKEIVDLKSVIDKKIVNLREAYSNGAKIIGGGKITKVLSVKIACTKLVKDQVEKAGGSVDNSNK